MIRELSGLEIRVMVGVRNIEMRTRDGAEILYEQGADGETETDVTDVVNRLVEERLLGYDPDEGQWTVTREGNASLVLCGASRQPVGS